MERGGTGDIVWMMCMLSVRGGYLFVGSFMMEGFAMGRGGDQCDVAAELEGDVPPLVDIAQAIILLSE